MFIRVHGGKKSHVYAVYTFHWQKYNNFSSYNVSKKISRCICRWECTHYQNHIPSPWLQHVTMIAPNHQGCTLDTMVTPWAELIHRTRITSWAELLSAFQAEEFLCGVHLMVQKFYDFSSANSAEMTNFATAK